MNEYREIDFQSGLFRDSIHWYDFSDESPAIIGMVKPYDRGSLIESEKEIFIGDKDITEVTVRNMISDGNFLEQQFLSDTSRKTIMNIPLGIWIF